ncbi:MAG: HAD family hydrolase [Phycisphaerae bacterium]|nr:HAD family hydrolase [Phycisphaerae bacterium]
MMAETPSIEFLCDPSELPHGPIRHALFDHDGTISTLRRGWEESMEQIMIESILGSCADSASPEVVKQVRNEVLLYIDRSTGVQTLTQMQELVKLVRRFGFVEPSQVTDALGYKRRYKQLLMRRVGRRIENLQRGGDPGEYRVRGALKFLQDLHARGVRLYLSSGTDREEVVAEARLLGYADLFDGGIFGASDEVMRESKELLLENLMNDLRINPAELVFFGDGPVEIALCRRFGGLAVGIASEETCGGLNPNKHRRLAAAGAQIIIPDFADGPALLDRLPFAQR